MNQSKTKPVRSLTRAISIRDLLLPQGTGNTWQPQASSWVDAAYTLRDGVDPEYPAPSAGQLSGATVIQAASACILDAHLDQINGYGDRVGSRVKGVPFAQDPVWNQPQDAWPFTRHLIVHPRLENPALKNLVPLHGDAPYRARLQGECQITDAACGEEAPLAPFSMPLPDILRSPARHAPDDLAEQLRYIEKEWAQWLSPELLQQLLHARDVLEEENRLRGGVGAGGGGEVHAPDLSMGVGTHGEGYWEDREGFSVDRHWMTHLVLIAKHSNVWLDQLSREFQTPVDRLDQIPDEALDRLAEQGFTGLWLIGLWERSPASRQIKQMRGNHDADASAYALRDYQIAGRFGGEEALQHLKARASSRGIRLAADMVPNHFGLDSRWMGDHPERFLQTEHSPYPGYEFTGENLSSDGRFQVYLEDGYWNETDAAVVFKRVDNHTGDTRFIYHGNDGTQMPWNDTAQLDYSNPEVREAIIQVIVDVARRFPIIRFDAAMTLAKRHIQRLWFPTPGDGGAIPSRASHALSEADFHHKVPNEFWREVVDRVAEEVPDTLLLAEAFWMMEAYFVRNLGMHRVYNSAFMHMLRDENNGGYKELMKKTLVTNPAIMQRFVNFMNNPDEDTAVDQFGNGDKYFGVTTLMATLPGLPMFGHGQLEGYAEKYGMEFLRATWDEDVDEGLLNYHRQVIFPLLHARDLYGSTEHFALFELLNHEEHVVDSVYATTNRGQDGKGRALVVFNNGHTEVSGRLQTSCPINKGSETEPNVVEVSLATALGFSDKDELFYGLKELRSGQWYLRSGSQLCHDGLFLHLRGYEAQVFQEMEEIHDVDGKWRALWEQLDGRGTPDLHRAFKKLHREPKECPLDRCAGLLLHPTSLPGPEGIGTLGDAAYQFLEWLQGAGITVWQMLPLCQAGPGHSPYSSPASFIGNPLLIDLERLVEDGLLDEEQTQWPVDLPTTPVDYDQVTAWKMPLLRQAAQALMSHPDHVHYPACQTFVSERAWLPDTLLFLALSNEEQSPWWEWDASLAQRNEDALAQARIRLADEIQIQAGLAFLFDQQWAELREAAEAKGIQLLGDLPLYVSRDSADVWANQECFELLEDGHPIRVAGVPPDAFSETGQLWGNPLYRWDVLEEKNYDWWVERLNRALEWTPLIRLDHFRGFSQYYAVPAEDEDAQRGTWVDGPGIDFFDALDEALGSPTLIAEDLGDIDDAVHQLRADTGYLCMRVLQFGFDGDDPTLHRAEGCPVDSVLYTGTHDNPTTVGWWKSLTTKQQTDVAKELGCSKNALEVLEALRHEAFGSCSTVAVVPAQDILGLDNAGRMNTPGTAESNWSWRLTEPLSDEDAQSTRTALTQHDRIPRA